jgi:hypothetical protein
MRTLSGCFALMSVVAAVTGCDDEPATSVVRGSIDKSTFLRPVQSVVTSADDGTKDRVFLSDAGDFVLELDKDKSHQIVLQQDGPSIPVALAGAHGLYDIELRVRGGGADVDLGRLRFYDGAGGDLGAESCVDGYYAGIEPCIGSEAAVSCDDGDGHGRGRGKDSVGIPELIPIEGAVAVPEFSVSGALGCHGDDHHGDDDDGGHDDDDGGHDDDD